jgi:hypothetical protein
LPAGGNISTGFPFDFAKKKIGGANTTWQSGIGGNLMIENISNTA